MGGGMAGPPSSVQGGEQWAVAFGAPLHHAGMRAPPSSLIMGSTIQRCAMAATGEVAEALLSHTVCQL